MSIEQITCKTKMKTKFKEVPIFWIKKYERVNKRADKWKKMCYTLKDRALDLQDRLDSLTSFCNELSTEKLDISIKRIHLQSRLDNETKKKNYWRLAAFLTAIILILKLVL